MGRLIDADALLKQIEKTAIEVEKSISDETTKKAFLQYLANFREDIIRTPIAYDVEKVVAELDESSFLMEPRTEGHYADNGVFLDEAIKIVRKGGVE